MDKKNIFDLPEDKDKKIEYYYRVLQMNVTEEERLEILSKLSELVEDCTDGEE